MMNGHGWHHMSNGEWDWGWGMVFGMGIFWILVIVGIVFLVRYLVQQSRGMGPQPPHETPLDILKKRYVRGEISKEEYDRIKKDITEP